MSTTAIWYDESPDLKARHFVGGTKAFDPTEIHSETYTPKVYDMGRSVWMALHDYSKPKFRLSHSKAK